MGMVAADAGSTPSHGGGAVVLECDGLPLVAHYGSVAAEIAVCMKTAGLVERSNVRQLSIAGPPLLLEHVLSCAVPGGAPKPGRALYVAGTWCVRVGAGQALVGGSSAAVARWRQVASRSIATSGLAVSTRALEEAATLSVVGPRAASVMGAAGLPWDLDVLGVAGAVLGGQPALVVREAADRFLLLLERGCPAQTWRLLTDAGRPFGLAPVGNEAVGRLRVAATHPPLALH